MATDHLQIPETQANQDQKEVTLNAADNLLDNAINDDASVSVTGDVTLTTTQTRENAVILLTGTPGAAFNVDMPDVNKRVLSIINTTDAIGTVRNSVGAGTTLAIPVGEARTFHYDGTDIRQIGGGGGGGTAVSVEDDGSQIVATASVLNFIGGAVVVDAGSGQADITVATPYDVGTFFGGTPGTSVSVLTFVFVRGVTLPSGLSASRGFAGTAPTAQTDFDLRRNGVSFGTMGFANASQTAAFTAASDTVFAAGDRLEVVTPGTLNTLADLVFTLAGTRN